jgi:arabinan endo-1,5-alpha-L-arabinosidase
MKRVWWVVLVLVAASAVVPGSAASAAGGLASAAGAAAPAAGGVVVAVGAAAAVPDLGPVGGSRLRPPGSANPDPIAHDPTIIKAGPWWYEIITGDIASRTYLPIKRSRDLVHWTDLGTVFQTAPAWVTAELGLTPGDFWAPDITFTHGEFRLYYAASSFGTNNSVIGLATARTLDPDSPDHGWVDHGMVTRTRAGVDPVNAIDPELAVDAAGGQWLAYGSFWDGISLRPVDPATGMLAAGGARRLIASRLGASIEGASISRRGGWYYLFVSLDFCCRGIDADYRTVVGRSRSITGPYLDAAGAPMLAGGGTEVLRGYDIFRGTGGGDVYSLGGVDLFAHHYYDLADNGRPKLSVRRISWVGGWPRLGDPLSGATMLGHGPAYLTIVNRASGAAISNVTCGYEGADIRLAAVAGDPCQQWRFVDRQDGYFSIDNRFSNKIAEVAACVDTDGARIAQWGWLHNPCQEYRLVDTDSGWFRVRNRLAGRVLTAPACAVGAPLQATTFSGDGCQQFRLDPVGDVLIADAAGRRVLGRPGLVRWRFVPAGEGFFRIVNARTGLALPGQRRLAPRGDGTYELVGRDGTALRFAGGTAVRILAP